MQPDRADQESGEREAFEAWYDPDADNRKGLALWHSDGGYRSSAPNYLLGAWAGWLASSSAKQEEVARLREATTKLLAAGKELLDAFDNTGRSAHERACYLQLAVASVRDAVEKVGESAALSSVSTSKGDGNG